MADANISMSELKNDLEVLNSNLDQQFLIICGIFVLFMQAGFAFLEARSVRSKNTTNIIMKNVLDVFIGALSYYAVGYAFAYGEPGNGFIGHNHFFASNVAENDTLDHLVSPSSFYAGWFYQFVFAATASTIVSGAVAERTEFTTYMVYCVFLTGFVYPVVSHWGWSDSGWLKTGAGTTGLSYQDFAGSGIVHVTGGTAALVGAGFLGPRIGRFNEDGSSNDIPGHSITVAALGGFILFVGFLAFNGGSQLAISGLGDGVVVGTAVMNTILGGSASAITALILYKLTDAIRGQDHYWSLIVTMNGCLAGMVAMCAGCNDIYPWAAVVIGVIAGGAFVGWHFFIVGIGIDDPLDAVAVHLGGGLCGVLLGPVFAVNGLEVNGEYVGGIIYGGHYMAFRNFAWNMLGAVVIMAWTGTITAVLFATMKKLGVLRVSKEVEINGLDKIKHGEPAYPLQGYSNGILPPLANGEKFGYENEVKTEENNEKETPEKQSGSSL